MTENRKEPPMIREQPFSYTAPQKQGWRWEIVEYSGIAVPTSHDGSSVTFKATGPLTRKVHPHRFWLRRSANRYLEQIREGR